MRHFAALAVGLVALWLILSGHYAPLTLALGGLSCVFVIALCARLRLVDAESVPMALLPRLPGYTLWLLGQIVRSNVDVAWRLLGPRRAIAPSLVRISSQRSSDLARAVFANSVTLTPGTVTIGLENGHFVIHSLTSLTEADITDGVMQARVRRLCREPGA